MSHPSQALSPIPDGLREPLLNEHRRIVQNYHESKWLPSELSGGRFCEIVYTILDGYASGSYASAPSKPSDFPTACKRLEKRTGIPRSFQILIPRLLPALYEVRNNRGVGHVGGDVDSNHMDATAVVAIVGWVMAELVRVFHQLPVDEAQRLVDRLVERRIPIVWQIGDVKRVLDPALSLRNQILLLVASCASGCTLDDLCEWTEYGNRSYLNTVIAELHRNRLVESSQESGVVQMLPPGSKYVEEKLVIT